MIDIDFCKICCKPIKSNNDRLCDSCRNAMRWHGYVQVVRCKNCKFYESNRQSGYCNKNMLTHRNPGFFCALGERNEKSRKTR